jgi:hypothetical protein
MSTLNFRYPDKPVECTPDFVVEEIDESEWLAQDKYDGWCMPVFFDGVTAIRCLSSKGRMLEDIAHAKFDMELQDWLLSLEVPNNTVLQTEYVGPRGDHESAAFIVDCHAWDGEWLVDMPFEQRWKLCQGIALPRHAPIRLAHTISSGFMKRFKLLEQRWINNGRGLDLCEGIVIKRRSGTLTLNLSDNEKSMHMFKLKYRDIREQRY